MNIIENFNKTGNQNIFEEVIDLMMVDELSEKHGINDEIKDKLKNLPTEQKRMVILGMLEEANNIPLFMNIKALTNKNINRMEHIKDVILMLREYVKVGEVEKKKFGEVMTPLELVKEMLQTLPDDVWSNPNLKWLDPANGTGPFPAMVIYKLMEGLKEWEPDDEKRYKHIIENMIYVSELQPKNMFLWLCVADPFDEYLTNIYTGSFLDEGFDEHMKEVWKVDKFDIVMGNPPYNAPSTDGKKGTTGKKNLYTKFMFKSLDILIEDGYLIFVNPPAFLKTTNFNKSTDIYSKIQNLNLLYLNLDDINDKYFKVGSPICYYLIQNNNKYDKTIIFNGISNSYVNIKSFNFIPRIYDDNIITIINKIVNKGINFNIIRDKETKTNKYISIQRLNHINKNGRFNINTNEDDKIFILRMDCEFPDDMKRILNLKLYRMILYTCRYDAIIYHYFFNGLKYPENYKNILNDKDIYSYFGLNSSEISFIDKIIE